MGFIFYLSNANGTTSQIQSDGLINITIRKIINIICEDLTTVQEEKIIEYFSFPIRKFAHLSEYFILSILVSLYIQCYKINLNKIIIMSFIICVLYACTDEFHQLFINGRSGEMLDVLIDSIGVILWLVIYYFYRRKGANI